MTVASIVRNRTCWALLALTCVLGIASPTLAQTQTQPPPRRTPPKTQPKPKPAPAGQPANPQPAQPEQPRTQTGEPVAEPPPQQPAGDSGQPSDAVIRDENGRVRIDPEVQRKIDEMLKQDESAHKAAEGQPNAPTPNPAAPGMPQPNPNPNPAAPAGTVPNPIPGGAQAPPVTPPGSPTPEAAKTPAQRAAERRARARGGADGAAGNPPGGQPNAGQPSVGQPAGNQPAPYIPQPIEAAAPVEPPGESTVLQIEPEPEVDPTPLEERRFKFRIKNGTYEQLIKGFAHQTGLGVLGETPKEGTVTFEPNEDLSFREALSRVRMLLFNYKPHEPYWMFYEGTHLQVIRVTDFYRILPTDRMFRSLEELDQANLSDDEIVLVIYTPKSGSISELRQVRDFLPDYVRVTPLEDGNSVSIFALVSDIKKYRLLTKIFDPKGANDPRVTERFDVHNITATQAVDRLRQLADLDNARAGTAPAARGPRGATPREPSAIDQMADPLVVMIPDDSQNYILVRGMPNKIEEIRKLLPFVDISLAQEPYTPVVIKVHNADAGDLVSAIQQVLSASAGPLPGGVAAPAPAPSPRRNKKPAAGGPSPAVPVSADSITLFPHPTQNALLVMADEAGVRKVQELVNLFDVKANIGPLRIQLEVADASEVVSTVTQVLGGGGGAAPGVKGAAAAAPESFQLVPDPSGSSIWYSGNESDLERVQSLVKALDVAGNSPTLHIVKLVYQQPSFVADILRQFDGVAPQAAEPAPAGQKPKTRRATSKGHSASKFTPDDQQKKLYILCNTDDFNRYQDIIAKLDQPEIEKDTFIRIPVKHIDSATAVGKLGDIMPNTPVNQDVRTIAVDGFILLVGASPSDVAVIKEVLAEIDKPSTIETRTFVIKHADPADIKTAIETLVGTGSSEGRSSGGSRRRPRSIASPAQAGEGGPKQGAASAPSTDATVSDDMTIFQIGNQLIVKATPAVLDQVAAVVQQFDVEGSGTDMRVYSDFPPNSDIIGISETLTSVFVGGAKAPRGARGAAAVGGGGAEGPRFIPQPATNRLVIMAEPSQYGEIERLLNILRVEAGKTEPSIVEFIPVEYADPTALAEEIRPLLDMKIRGLVDSGEIAEPAAESTTPTAVPRPNRAKKLQQGGSGSEKYHIGADAHNERIVIAAPQRIVDEAKQLIKQFDVPAKGAKIVFKQVTLDNASPADMVKSIKEMIGNRSATAAPRRAAGGKPGAPGAAPAASPLEGLGGEGLVVTEAPGGGAVLLKGTQAEVDQAEDWIHQLDSMSSRGLKIKLYKITGTDTEKLFDLIVSVVDVGGGGHAPAAGATPRRGAPTNGSKSSSSVDDEEFSTSRTHSGQDLYLHADLISDTLLVASKPSKLQQIDDLVMQFTTDKTIAGAIKDTDVPSFRYTLEFADATDAKWDLEDLIDAVWEGKEKPKIEKFKDMLIVKYPDESRFDEIRKMIKDLDKPSEKESKLVKVSKVPPAGLSPRDTAIWIKQNHPDWDIEIEDAGIDQEQPTYGVEQLKPIDGPKTESLNKAKPAARGRVDAITPGRLPLPFQRTVDAILFSVLAQTPPDEEQPEPGQEEVQPQEEPEIQQPVAQPVPRDFGDRLIRQAVTPILPQSQAQNPKDSGSKTTSKDAKKSSNKGKKARIIYNNNDGVYWIESDKDSVDDIENSLDDLDKELKDIVVAPDIRIYRVRYIDVYSAQEIIEEMFNATKAMQQQVQQQQAQQNAMMRAQQQQQLQQQRLQQQQGQQGRGQEGKDAGKNGQQTPQQLAAAQQMAQQMQVPQLPTPAVRVYPNPRDRSLILRAESSQYPHILELLATIDQPKPIDSKTRTYPLKRVSATEMEQMLRETLRLDEAGSKSRANSGQRNPNVPGGGAQSATGPGGQLPETILQESATKSLLGVDPQDITIFSSETANTIMAVAPPAALDYIGKLIEQFESGDIPERLTRFYAVQHASVTDVAQQLEDYFAAKHPRTSGGGGGRSSRKGSPEGASPAAASHEGGGLNAPSFIPYERLNQLTVHGTQEQITEVEEVLTRLDVPSEEDTWQDVALAHADAKLVADTLTEMFGGGGAGAGSTGPGKPGRPAGAASGGNGAKFIGESGGRIIFYSAPKARQPEILATIAKLEEKSKQTSQPRVIELKNATPSQVAEAIEKAYDVRRTGAQGGAAPKTARFTVTGHDPSHRLFVVADDEMFAQISSLITTLDQPGSSNIGIEFRIYPLQYASAKAVHSQLTKLMTDYIQRLGPNAPKMEAFSVQPDETANALVVLGTPSVFGFIEENLRKIDTPGSKASMPEVHVVNLKNADPDAVTRALTEIFVRNAAKSADGDAPISISAASGSKAVMIRANAVDFARIQTAINELDTDEIATGGEVRVVTMQYGDASEIKTALESYLQKPAGTGARSAQLVGDVRLAVMPQTNAIMISGDKDTLDRLESIAKGMDIAGEKGSVPQIITLKFASASMILPQLKEMFSDPKYGGGRKGYTAPVIVADEGSNALIVRAGQQELTSIQGIVSALDTEDKVDKSAPRIIQVALGINLQDLADDTEDTINETAKARLANTKGVPVPAIKAIANLRTNTITLAGSAMLFDEAEAFIKAQEKMGPAGGKTTVVIGPKNIATEDLQRLIDQLTQKQSSGGSHRGGSSSGSAPRPPRTNR